MEAEFLNRSLSLFSSIPTPPWVTVARFVHLIITTYLATCVPDMRIILQAGAPWQAGGSVCRRHELMPHSLAGRCRCILWKGLGPMFICVCVISMARKKAFGSEKIYHCRTCLRESTERTSLHQCSHVESYAVHCEPSKKECTDKCGDAPKNVESAEGCL